MDVRQDSGAVHIHVCDRLDTAKAERIRRVVGEHDHRAVVLDFHDTRSFDLAALASLARWLVETDRKIVLHGLSDHHHRLLRYVGLQRLTLEDPSTPTRTT